MASRKPLVIIDGVVQQLPVNDILNVALTEGDLTTGTNKEVGAIVKGTPVYVSGAGEVKKAKADAIGTAEVLGLVADGSIAADASGNIQTDACLTCTTGEWDAITGETGGLTEGAVYYLDPSTAGKLTSTAPTTATQVVTRAGLGLTTTQMLIAIAPPILL